MDFRKGKRVLADHWRIIVILALAGGFVGAATAAVKPPEYTASIKIFIAAQTGGGANGAYQGTLLSQERVTSYLELLQGNRVARDVATRLGLPDTPQELSSNLEASSATDSLVIDVAVTQSDPARAAQVANVTGEVFGGLVAQLEQPLAPNSIPLVSAKIVQNAVVPGQPSSPGWTFYLALGLVTGLLVGVVGALARSLLDTTVRTVDQLVGTTGAPNLAIIPIASSQVSSRIRRPHQAQAAEESVARQDEAFRRLRTNLQYVSAVNEFKALAVSSSLPGEGKTYSVLNLAKAMASSGKRVVVVEADLRRPTLASLTGLEGSVGLTTALSQRSKLAEVTQRWGSGGFDLITSGPLPPNPSELLASERMARTLDELRSAYDAIIIDTPPLLPVTDGALVASSADSAVLVCRYSYATTAQIATALSRLEAVSARLSGTVFSMTPDRETRSYGQYDTYYSTTAVQVPAEPVPASPRLDAATDRVPAHRGYDRPAPHRRDQA